MAGVHEPVDQVLPRVHSWIRQAAAEGAQAVFLPELIIGHYHQTPVTLDGPEIESVARCVRQTGAVVGVGIGERRGNELFSSYAVIAPDGSVGIHRKTRWQTPRCPISLGTEVVAHDVLGRKVGILICAETRFPEVARSLVAAEAQVLIMPHAYGIGGPGWQPLRTAILETVAARCRETSLAALVIAATGDGFEGGCALVSGEGQVLYERLGDRECIHHLETDALNPR